jgi:hypothetical protein
MPVTAWVVVAGVLKFFALATYPDCHGAIRDLIRQQAPPIPDRATRAGTEGKPSLDLELVQSTSGAFCPIKIQEALETPQRHL